MALETNYKTKQVNLSHVQSSNKLDTTKTKKEIGTFSYFVYLIHFF